jgi:hypothetical protein
LKLSFGFNRAGFTGSLDLQTTESMHSFVSDHIEAVDHIITVKLTELAYELNAYRDTVILAQRTGDEPV